MSHRDTLLKFNKLVKTVADKSGRDKDLTHEVIDNLLLVIQEAMQRNEELNIRGFGKFYCRDYGSFYSHNYVTRQFRIIPPRIKPAWKWSKVFYKTIKETSMARLAAKQKKAG